MTGNEQTHGEFMDAHEVHRHGLKKVEKDETILMENHKRFVLFPIKYHEVYEAYKKREAKFWTAEEIDFAKDIKEFQEADDERKYALKRMLAILLSNYLKSANLTEQLSAQVQIPEAKCFYGFEIMVDNIHQEVYSLLLDGFVKEDKERASLFRNLEVDYGKFIASKKRFVKNWLDPLESLYSEKLIAFACAVGIFDSSIFASLLSLRNEGTMPGLTTAMELILSDQSMHADFSCLMLAHLKNRPSSSIVRRIVNEAVAIEQEALNELVPLGKLNGKVSSAEMRQYVEYVADCLLVGFGDEKLYNATNPFDFLEGIPQPGNSNSFERKVSEYEKAGSAAANDTVETGITFNDEF